MQDIKNLLGVDKAQQEPKFKTPDAKILADQSKNSGDKLDSFNRLKQDEEAKANEKISNRKKGLSYFLLATVLLLGACAFMGAIPAGAVLVAFLCAPMAKLLGDVAISQISDSGKKIARLKNRAYLKGDDLTTTSTHDLKKAQNPVIDKSITIAQDELQKLQVELQKAQIEKQKAELQKEIDTLKLSKEEFKINEINDKLNDKFGIGSNIKDKTKIEELVNTKITDQDTKTFIAEQVADLRDDTKTPEEKATARRTLDEIFKEYDDHNKSQKAKEEGHKQALTAIAASGGAAATNPTFTKTDFTLDKTKQQEIKGRVVKKMENRKQPLKGDGQTV